MKRACDVRVREDSWVAGHTRALIIGLATVWMASMPTAGWGQQWSGTGPIYYNGGNVGIGTATPTSRLDVGTSSRILFWPDFTGANEIPAGAFISSNGGSLFLIPSPDGAAGSKLGIAYFAGGGLGWRSALEVASTVTGSGKLLLMKSGGNVGIGTGTIDPQYLLSVNGTMGAKEVIVTNTGWSDYVFRPDYRLRPLSEVNAYIQENHHLPDIPSEAEVKEKGVSVGEMQSKLLAKIEELTLHMIEQDRENRALRARMSQMERELVKATAPTTIVK